jgi:diguanylate cyclase (GGDEF)-like protein
MTERSRSRSATIAAFVFLIVAAIGAAFVRLVENRRLDARRQSAEIMATAQANALLRQIEGAVAVDRQIAALVRQGGDAVFAPGAMQALRQTEIVSGMALAPSARITEVQPAAFAGDIGMDLVADPLRGPDATRALQGGTTIVGVPIARMAEGTMIHVYEPVAKTLVIAYIPLENVLRASDMRRLVRAGYDYRLSRSDAASGRMIPFLRSTELELYEPMAISIDLPGSRWSLDLAPRSGWSSRLDVIREAGVALIVALLVALFVYDILRRPERLELEVQARTHKLLEAHRRITTEVEYREKAEELAKHEATHDKLTGLPNRRFLLDGLARALDRAHRHADYRFGVLFLDLDRFTVLNDSLGHAAGDQLLVGVARRLESSLRLGDIVGRVGGDEFLIVVFEVEEITDLMRVANRCHEALEVPFVLDQQEAFSSASIGIAVSTTGYSRADDLIRDANLAMLRARREGGARHIVFDPHMHARAVNMLQIESELRRAIDQRELRAFFQPIVSLISGKICGFEALIRWCHPQRGFVSPGAFLPVAEASGLIIAIDRWIMREAARQLHALHQNFPSEPPLYVSVNVSGKRLTDPGLLGEVGEVLLDTGLDPRGLRIEITEGEMMENTELVISILQRLKRMDLTLLVDDFGTGFSSLSYLQRFPVDIVKVDQSFVRGMITNPKDEEIVRAVVNLAEILGLGVVAEGIETAEHLAHLKQLGCSYGQGYLFSKPVDTTAIEALLRSNPQW